jgi:arylsulfatase A-like enzyme
MTSKRRVVYYLADGAHAAVLPHLLQQGHLPNLKRIAEEGTYRTATTCFPSTTGPAYLPFLTGHFPGSMHITGIRWFDKAEYKRKRWGNRQALRSYCGPQARLFNADLPAGKPTLLELAGKSYNLYNMITRGVPPSFDLGRKGKSWLYLRAHFFGRNHPVDELGHARIMDMLHRGNDFDFLFAVFPSIDWDSHYYDIRDKRTLDAYRIVDQSVGELRDFLEKKGWWQNTLFLLGSDHGLTATHTHFDLDGWLSGIGLPVLSHPVTWKRNPAVAVTVSGNSFASLHFLRHEGGHPLRAAALLHQLGKSRLDELVRQTAIDFILYRDDRPGSLVVHNHTGRALIKKEANRYTYFPETADPFGLLTPVTARNHREALELTFDSSYPDCLVQAEQLFRSHRAGDIVVCAKKGFDLRSFWEIPAHKGSHGSLYREHMHVPLLYNQKNWAQHAARTADLFSTILQWLNLPVPPSEGDSLLNTAL